MMNLFVVWALSIVVSIETTLFYGKTFDVSHSVFLINLKTRHRFTIWVRVIGYMAKTSRESKGIVFVTYDNSTNLVQVMAIELQHSICW